MNSEIKINKSEWGPGPWQSEPDRIEFEHCGFPCLMLRHDRYGHWCGYVAVTSDHPWFEKDYDALNVDVHGGVTYAEHCSGNVCHVPKPGESDNVWWVGFDFAHSGDLSPGMSRRYSMDYGYYKDVRIVKNECERVAKQALAVAP